MADNITWFFSLSVFAVVLGLIVSALQVAGVIEMVPARILLFIAWLIATISVGAHLNESAPFQHRVIAASLMGIPFGAVLLLLERWITRTVAKREVAENDIPLSFEQKQEAGNETLQPNIVCIGSDTNLFVIRDSRQVLREVERSDLKGIVVVFQNQAHPTANQIIAIDNVKAQVTYYRIDLPYNKIMDYSLPIIGEWLNQESPSVSFGEIRQHRLVLGVRQKEAEKPFEFGFSAYEKYSDPYEAPKRIYLKNNALDYTSRTVERVFIIEVELFTSTTGKILGKFEFELTLNDWDNRIIYLTDEVKSQREQMKVSNLEYYIREGRNILKKATYVNSSFDYRNGVAKLREEVEPIERQWLDKVISFISRNLGGDKFGTLTAYPNIEHSRIVKYDWKELKMFEVGSEEHFFLSIYQQHVDRLYTNILHLEKLLEEIKSKEIKKN
jgi:hypothetical protein